MGQAQGVLESGHSFQDLPLSGGAFDVFADDITVIL